jgi:hypothetical protein
MLLPALLPRRGGLSRRSLTRRKPKRNWNLEYKKTAAFARGAKLHSAPGIHKCAEIRSDQKNKKVKSGGDVSVAVMEGKIMELSIETKVAIAVATGFVVLVVGAMAQG